MADRINKVRRIFDKIAGATYYGIAFRKVLLDDDEALQAAEKLLERLRVHRVGGLRPHTSTPCHCPGCKPELYAEGARRQQELAEAEKHRPGSEPQTDRLVVDNHCTECGEVESECVCCGTCDGSGKLPDGSLCACARCPECGAMNPFEPAKEGCEQCEAARDEVARQAEREAGWDPSR